MRERGESRVGLKVRGGLAGGLRVRGHPLQVDGDGGVGWCGRGDCGAVDVSLAGDRGVWRWITIYSRRTMSLLLSWLVLSLAVWITAMVLPGFHVKGFGDAILVALFVGLLNFLLGWLFFTVFTIVTLGLAWLLAFLTRWIINAIILKLADSMTDRLKIDSFGWALGGALMISVIGAAADWVIRMM